MNAETVRIIYFAALVVQASAELLLVALNVREIRRRGAEVPSAFRAHIDSETYVKSQRYSAAKSRFAVASIVYAAVLKAVVVGYGVFAMLDGVVSDWTARPYLRGAIFLVLLTTLSLLIQIPFSLYSTFVLEAKFGFNKTSFRTWCADFAKELLLSAIILTPLILVLLWVIDLTGSGWWIWGFVVVAAFQLVMFYLFPSLIAPLFNKFSPMPEGELREAILAMATRLDFKTAGIFVMDGSRRSAHANAYFTGLGAKKRIVLFDTLVKLLSESQLLAVLAHEIGHEKRGHIKRMLIVSMVLLFVGFFCLKLLVAYPPVFTAFGFRQESMYAALTIVSLVLSPLAFFLSPALNALSRSHEYEADRFAVAATGNPLHLSDALLALSKESLSNLTPHPLYSFFHYSHPTLAERIAAMHAAA